ncbi:MAG: hypothetical protein U9O94_02605 [Nanoarchaeota archaeon]|nr:hypothetical protein [Nanoarchaeota archaeon]
MKAKEATTIAATKPKENGFSTPAINNKKIIKDPKNPKKTRLAKMHILRYSLTEKSISACLRCRLKNGKEFCRDSPIPKKI